MSWSATLLEASEANPGPEAREALESSACQGRGGVDGQPEHQGYRGYKYGIRGPRDNPDPHLAKQAALADAARFGMIGLIATMGGGDPNAAQQAPWGREESSGTDEKGARGNIARRRHRRFGRRRRPRPVGRRRGWRRSRRRHRYRRARIWARSGDGARAGDRKRTRSPARRSRHQGTAMRDTMPNVNGRIPREVIQRIVRQNFGRFRLCYENSLRSNPNLQGARDREVRHRPAAAPWA